MRIKLFLRNNAVTYRLFYGCNCFGQIARDQQEIMVQALLAGHDLLLIPRDLPKAVATIEITPSRTAFSMVATALGRSRGISKRSCPASNACTSSMPGSM